MLGAHVMGRGFPRGTARENVEGLMTTLPVSRLTALLAIVLTLACSKPSATAGAMETGEPSATAPRPQAASATPTEPSATPVSATPVLPPEPAASAPAAAKPPPQPQPQPGKPVKVVHIGMHIGGGPNDDVTKEPIRASVRPHFAELSACYAATGSKVESDFGVDLLIPEAGGKAQVSHPRSTLKGAPPELSTCIVAVFEETDFKRPLTGRTVVSYAMRFTP